MESKPILRRIANRLLATLAQVLPGATTARPFFHRLRGVHLGADVFIGDGVYLENEFPECIAIGDHSALAPRVMVIAHVGRTDRKEGPLSGQVIIGKHVFIGAMSFIGAGPEATVTIGDGATIGAGVTIVNRSIAPGTLVTAPPFMEIATCEIPLTAARSYNEFVHGIHPIRPKTKGRSGLPHG